MQRAWVALGKGLYYATCWNAISIALQGSYRVRGVVIAEEHVLLVRTWLGHQRWTLPGGGVARGEPVEAALQREIHEEVGVSVPKFSILYADREKECLATFHQTYMIGNLHHRTTIKKAAFELIEARWVALDDVPHLTGLDQTVAAALRYVSEHVDE